MVLHYHFFNRSSRGFLHKILDFLRFCKKLNFLLHQPTYILRSQYCTSIKAPNKKLWLRILVRQPCLHGQAVKTSPSHGENWGSSPHGAAKALQSKDWSASILSASAITLRHKLTDLRLRSIIITGIETDRLSCSTQRADLRGRGNYEYGNIYVSLLRSAAGL